MEQIKDAWEKCGKLYAEGNKLRAEGYKLCAEGRKLLAEGDKLCAESDLVYVNAVIDKYGPKAIINWEDGTVTV